VFLSDLTLALIKAGDLMARLVYILGAFPAKNTVFTLHVQYVYLYGSGFDQPYTQYHAFSITRCVCVSE